MKKLWSWPKENYWCFGIFFCSVGVWLLSNPSLIKSILLIPCMFGLLIFGYISGIKQVKGWEQKQSDHWLEYKSIQEKRRK